MLAGAHLTLGDLYSWLSFTCVHATKEKMWEVIDRCNLEGQEIVLSEFMAICTELLWDVPLQRLAT